MKILGLISGIILISTPVPGDAQENAAGALASGNNFALFCNGVTTASVSCLAYTLGVFHALRETTRGSNVCLPNGVDTGQLFSVGVKYIRENPELGHYAPAPLLIASWERAFPCAGATAH
jgi:hypothetical protein